MKRKILSLIIAGVISQSAVFSAPSVFNVIPQTGTINTHDMDTLKNRIIEDEVTKDFKNYKKNRKEKDKLQQQEHGQECLMFLCYMMD